jgi:error-prone DNA polymerase
MGLDRRQALWEISSNDQPVALFAGQTSPDAIGENISLPVMSPSEHVVHDYATTALSLKAHPVSFVREKLQQLHILPLRELGNLPDGMPVKVAGLVLVRQRPGTAQGVCFITIEDETGFANLVVFQALFDKYRKPILQSKLLMVEGKLQREGEVIHVIVKSCHNLSPFLRQLVEPQDENILLSKTEEKKDVFPGARNFK